MSLLKAIGAVVAVPAAAVLVGLLFGILPCYLFTPLDLPGTWCGYKGAPPHFEAQFWLGAAVGGSLAGWRIFRRR